MVRVEGDVRWGQGSEEWRTGGPDGAEGEGISIVKWECEEVIGVLGVARGCDGVGVRGGESEGVFGAAGEGRSRCSELTHVTDAGAVT